MISMITEYDIQLGKCRHSPFRIKILPNAMLRNNMTAGAPTIAGVA